MWLAELRAAESVRAKFAEQEINVEVLVEMEHADIKALVLETLD